MHRVIGVVRSWRCIALLLLALCAAAVAWDTRLGEEEPLFRGLRLSEWITMYNVQPRGQEAAAAIRQIGTNALPWLLKWLRYDAPHWRTTLVNRMDDLPRGVSGHRVLRRFLEGPARGSR
jgi:hypothetical protein